ncbi:phosphomevalonate kinase [Aquibacillus rhizosphaerae]|uniref:phosphomevalonate kinase n=1 Tax=Aquibacillus rhizosphaerae TaxID=3051431 RepID=A0ABT7L2V5_9BACI|nr:phosphomevalonate kinase [Aquibacillus sp. LR5S19]MDL4840182.1 phosphomevalonate kinase [Aquibacillus sp. LR5S19]
MPNSNYKVKVPGKLFIAGEYAVLEPGQEAIVIAINRYITFTIETSNKNQLSLPQLSLEKVSWTGSGNKAHYNVFDKRLRFIQNTISLVDDFLHENLIALKPIHLTVSSELDDEVSGRKYGLGSSAAIVVGIVTAMLNYYKQETIKLSPDLIFKLAAIAHFKTQGSGSGADIAASTFGGWIRYSSFQPDWIEKQLEQGVAISELVKKTWPKLVIDKITPPPLLELCVGWTGSEAATAPMINKIQALRDLNPSLYAQFLQESSTAVAGLVNAFEQVDCLTAINSLKKNRQALLQLSNHANGTIETPMLTNLVIIAERYGSGKSSGAGGGDCGIAFVAGENKKQALHSEWKSSNISPLDLSVSEKGASLV